MSETSLHKFRLEPKIVERVDYISQTFHSVLDRNSLKFQTCCNFVKNDFFSSKNKKRGAHFQYACNICSKFQIDCLKFVGGVDYTNFP